MRYLKILGRILEITGIATFATAVITMAIVLWAAAIFGGSISVKINNPFWDNKEATE